MRAIIIIIFIFFLSCTNANASKRISLNFQNIDIHAVLQLMAEFEGINIVVSERVHGFVTLRLKDIPWEKALEFILNSQKLVMHQEQSVIFIDTESIMDNTHNKGSKSKLMDQIVIEARIVQVSKDFEQDLGIKWGVSTASHFAGSLQGANQIAQGVNQASIPLADRLNVDLAAAASALVPPASVGLALAQLGEGILLDLELQALESEGRAELISSPRLITTNQQAAVIESGQEIPYQEALPNGVTAVSFKKAVLSLKVTPQIIAGGKVMMDLQINQDTVLPHTYNGVPAIATKEIQTNVLVHNGQTVVLGGIYTQNKNKTINRVPFLGSLPVVGNLFKNSQVTVNNHELIIFITPKILPT